MIMAARKILLVLAHPDDESFICGGTLAKYAKGGADIMLVCATKGEMGRRVGVPPIVSRETLSTLRVRELEQACRVLGIGTLQYLGLIDKTVEFADERELTDRIASIMESYAPDVVLTFHQKLGGHPDHCAIGKVCTAAFHRLQKPSAGKSGKPAHLYFITFGDMMKQPEKYGIRPDQISAVDIRGYEREKLYAFRAHRTQSEIIDWVWRPDQEAIRAIGRYEYFIRG
jgi:N-acetylglucosamine malate deacetylase 2